jgi:hypothetical protein
MRFAPAYPPANGGPPVKAAPLEISTTRLPGFSRPWSAALQNRNDALTSISQFTEKSSQL